MSAGVSTQKSLVNILLVYLLLFASGTWVFMLSKDKFLVIVFLAALAAWFLFSDRKFSDRFLLYMIIFAGFHVLLSLYTGGSLSLASAIGATMQLAIPYLIIRTVGERFVYTYIVVLVFLAVLSLFGYMSDLFNLFDGLVTKLPRVGDKGYEGILYLFRFPWHIDRNNSIFFEPGAYQGFLNGGIFLLLFGKHGLSKKRTWIYIVILAVTLGTTLSTTGLLVFAGIYTLFFFRSELLSTMGKIKVISATVVMVSLLSAQFYSSVVLKVDEYLSADEGEMTTSARARRAGAGADIKIFKEHVFGIGFDKYMKEYGVAFEGADIVGSSNGVTRSFAQSGLPFSLFLFGSYYWALRRLLKDYLLTAGAFAMFIVFLAGEAYYMSSPISFAIIAAAFIYNPALKSEKPEPA